MIAECESDLAFIYYIILYRNFCLFSFVTSTLVVCLWLYYLHIVLYCIVHYHSVIITTTANPAPPLCSSILINNKLSCEYLLLKCNLSTKRDLKTIITYMVFLISFSPIFLPFLLFISRIYITICSLRYNKNIYEKH